MKFRVKRDPGVGRFEYASHDRNYGLRYVLRTTRATRWPTHDNSTIRQVVVALVLSAMGMRSASAVQVGKTDIVARATVYVVDFVQHFANLVAEEQYVQETNSPRRRRELRSDFLLTRPPGSTEWFQFRDVFEVDGRPVRNRDERLAKLFLEAPTNAVARAREVTHESSRFSLEDVGTLNLPLYALSFLQPDVVSRFRLVIGPLDKGVGEGVRLVQFFERQRPTLLRRAAANGDLPASGKWWIEESTGRVLRTELRVEGSEIVTSFAYDDALQTAVPTEMRDRYLFGVSELNGVARYGRFRRFGVSTEEALKPATSTQDRVKD